MIPYGRQSITQEDINSVTAVLNSDFLTTGPAVQSFEREIEKLTGAEYAVVCSNGTAALHMACYALGIKAGDKVIVPAVTFLATASAPHIMGAEIIFADVDQNTGNLTPESLEKASGDYNIKAVFPVHMGGDSCDMAGIKEVADKKNIRVVEDACHAIGGHYGGAPIGRSMHSDMTVFSFHPVKTITSGEGGAITTNCKGMAERLKLFRNHGMIRGSSWHYELHDLGLNYRLSDIHAALGLSQIKRLQSFIKKRHKIMQYYNDAFQGIDFIQTLPLSHSHGAHLYRILIDFEKLGKPREQVMQELKDNGIGSQVHYIPLPMQPFWKGKGWDIKNFPGAKKYYDRVLSLPLYIKMMGDNVERVISGVNNTCI